MVQESARGQPEASPGRGKKSSFSEFIDEGSSFIHLSAISSTVAEAFVQVLTKVASYFLPCGDDWDLLTLRRGIAEGKPAPSKSFIVRPSVPSVLPQRKKKVYGREKDRGFEPGPVRLFFLL